MPKLQISLKSCEELQAALNTARAMLQPPTLDPGTGLGMAREGGGALNAPEAPAGILEEIRQIEQAMREAGCAIST
jgi:hypothetical protein